LLVRTRAVVTESLQQNKNIPCPVKIAMDMSRPGSAQRSQQQFQKHTYMFGKLKRLLFALYAVVTQRKCRQPCVIWLILNSLAFSRTLSCQGLHTPLSHCCQHTPSVQLDGAGQPLQYCHKGITLPECSSSSLT